MANYDNPNGFRPRFPTPANKYTAGGTFAYGDMVRLNASGQVVIATASDEDLLGVAAVAGSSGATVQVFDDPAAEFYGQCSGSYATTHDGDLVDIEGTTGIQEVNEDATVRGVLKILRQYPVTGSTDTGNYARVLVKIARHQKASAPVVSEGTQTFETLSVTGTSTLAGQVTVGGGYGDTGVTISAAGVVQANGAGTFDGALNADGGLDRSSAAALAVGATNANAVNLSKAGTATTVKGSLTVDQTSTFTGVATFTSTPVANAIGERTAGSGVTVDGALIKDGAFDPAKLRVLEDFLPKSGATLPVPWATQDTSAAGSPTLAYIDNVANGAFQLTHDGQSEAQNLTLYWNDQLTIDPTKAPIFEARVRINVTGATLSADQRVVVGLASARNATLDNVASHAWFRFEGANLNILIEGDDGTTDTDDVDSTIDYADNTWMTLRIDMTTLSAVVFSINGTAVGTTVNLAALAASNLLQPYVEIQRDAGTEADRIDVDYVMCTWNRT